MKYNFQITPKILLLSISSLVTVLILLTYSFWNQINLKNSKQTLESAVASTTKEKTVTALGRIKPKDKLIKLSGPSHLFNGRVTQILVQEGDFVEKGQMIATLDNFSKQQAVLAAAQQKVKIAKAQLEQVLAGEGKLGEITAQQAIIADLEAQFQGQVETNKAIIARLDAELLRQKQVYIATIARLKAELQTNQVECERYEKLLTDGAASKSERDRTCLQSKVTEEQLNETKANRNLTIETLEQQLNEAKANQKQTLLSFPQQILRAEATRDRLQEVRPVDKQVAEAQLQESLIAVTEAEADLELASVKAPIKGQILKIHTFPGERITAEGIADLGQTQSMYVFGEIYESDITEVAIGQTAIISSSSLPINFQGKVEQIGLQISAQNVVNQDPTLDLDARVFEVKIRLDDAYIEQAAKFINLQVEVAINLNS